MITIRHANERPRTRLRWLDGHHSFSFGSHYDPNWNGFGPLVVINDDVIAPSGGFPEHPHDNMEIISYVVEGALAHKDSTGTQRTVTHGGVQRMTAGTGVTHSEHNDSGADPAHLLQIWLFPERRGLQPSYEQRAFDVRARPGEWVLVASRDGRDGSVTIHQGAEIGHPSTIQLDWAPGRASLGGTVRRDEVRILEL